MTGCSMVRQAAPRALISIAALLLCDAADQQLKVAAGRSFSFVLDHSSKAFGFGRNDHGQLDQTEQTTWDQPYLIETLKDKSIIQVAAGAFHSLFLTDEKEVFGMGRDNFGQLASVPSGTEGIIKDVKSVAAGYAHSLFLKEDGSVYACGLNGVGQLGIGSAANMAQEPTKVEGLPVIKKIVAGYDFSYFIAEDGRFFATGQNLAGQLGVGNRRSQRTPVQAPLASVKDAAAGETHGVVLLENETVLGFGASYDGQLGGGDQDEAGHVQVVASARSISAGGSSTFYTNSAGVYGVGSNRMGQLGLNSATEFYTEAQRFEELEVGELEMIAVGDSHSLFAMRLDSEILGEAPPEMVYACGSGENGELGNAESSNSNALVQVQTNWDGAVITSKTTTITTTTTPSSTSTPPSSTTVDENVESSTTGENNETGTDPNMRDSLDDRLTWIACGGVLFGVFGFFLCTSPDQEEEQEHAGEQGTEMA